MVKEKEKPLSENMEIFALFRYLTKQLDIFFNNKLEKDGLTSQQGRAIFCIYRHLQQGKAVRQTDLQTHLRLTKSSTSGLVKRLLNNGLILKDSKEHHNALTLTPKGEKVVVIFEQIRKESKEQLFKGFTSKEQARMRTTLTRMIANIKKEE